MKYLRCTTSAAAGNGLGTAINEYVLAMYNERGRGQWPGHHDHVPATHNERCRGQWPSATIKYLRRSSSGAAGSGLYTTANYVRGATGIGLGTTIKYLVNKNWADHIVLGIVSD